MAWKELTVDEWTDEIGRGLEYRRLYGVEDSWRDLEALFYNVHSSSQDGPNIISSTGDALISQLGVPNPELRLGSRQGNKVVSTRVLENIDNDLFEDLEVSLEVENAILNAFLFGVGILKIGYDSEFGWDPEFDLGDENQYGLSSTQFDKRGVRIEFGGAVPGMPWVKSVPTHDIIVPYGTRSFKDAPWVAHRVLRHVEDVKADRKYSKTRDIKAVMSMSDYVKSYQTTIKPYRIGQHDSRNRWGSNRVEFCELWEIHDRRTGKVIVIATGHKSFLRKDRDRLQLKGQLPFVDLRLVPSTRTFWVTPDAYYLKHSQAELCDISIQASKQRRIAILKFLMSEDAFDKFEADILTSADVGAVAMVKGGIDLRQAIIPMTPSNNNQQLYQDAEAERRNAQEVVGFSRNQIGQYEQKGRRTAEEARIVQAGSSIRMSRRQIIIRRVYVSIIKVINPIIFKYWTTPRWTNLGSETDPNWVNFIGKDLKGDYKYDVRFSSGPDQSIQQRKQEAIQLYAMLSQDPSISRQGLRKYLQEAFNDPELGSIFEGANRADISTQMSQMQPQGGGVQKNQRPK